MYLSNRIRVPSENELTLKDMVKIDQHQITVKSDNNAENMESDIFQLPSTKILRTVLGCCDPVQLDMSSLTYSNMYAVYVHYTYNQQIGASVCSGFLCSRCADLKPFRVHHVLDKNVNTHEPNVNSYDTKTKQSQTHGKHHMRSTATQKLILCWNTIFRVQVKHTVVFREHPFAG